jgi:opacity protein-like surface antigen
MSAPALAQYQSTPAPTPPPSPSASGSDMHIIPKNGQTQDQQWNDRYACDSWAKGQSGFDPTQAASLPPEEANRRREQYRQDITACLDNRGYEVQFGAPPHAAPPPVPPPPVLPPPHPNEIRYHPLMVDIAGGYTITTGDTSKTLQDGGSGSLALTWFPTAKLPLGIRFEGSYSRFNETLYSRELASMATGANVGYGHSNLYGGNIDARLDLAHRPGRFQMYLFGGFGRYRQQTVFKEVTTEFGLICYYYCFPGYAPVESTVSQTTSDWVKSWNAGFGMEWALSEPVRFFIEGRYLRLAPYDQKNTFIPVQIGLRF